MSLELIIKRVVHDDYLTIVKINTTSLTVEQIQIMSGLVFALNYHRYQRKDGSLNLSYQLNDNTMVNTDIGDSSGDSFTWTEEGIIRTYNYHNTPILYLRRENGEHLSISGCEEEKVTVTFKNGRLDSAGDHPAISSLWGTSVGGSTNLWFTNDVCYRSANPQLPARESGTGYHDFCYHHNAEGKIFRDPSAGPAAYQRCEYDGKVIIKSL